MGFNKKVLSKAVSELGKAKAPGKPKDIITDPAGQWKYPGQKTRIPGNDITMQDVPYPVWAQPNVGPGSMMQPNQDYNFPGASYVDETPMAKKGGTLQSKKYSKSMSATNKLFTKNKLFQNKKSKIFDPNAEFKKGGSKLGTINLNPNPLSHYELNYGFNLPTEENGGEADYEDLDLTDEEIQAYRDGGYVVEELPEAQVDGPQNTSGPRAEEIPADVNAMNTMMKARMATDAEFGNPAARRMTSPNPKTYDFGNGDLGTHFMASMGNQAVPLLQDKGDDELEYNENPPPSKEDMNFRTPEEAQYFAEHYKEVAPMMRGFKQGGYVQHELVKAQKGKTVKPYYTSDPKKYAFKKAAYDDSLYLYNSSFNDYNNIKKFTNLNQLEDYRNKTSNNKFHQARNNLNYPDYEKVYELPGINYRVGVYKKPVQPVKFVPKPKPAVKVNTPKDRTVIHTDKAAYDKAFAAESDNLKTYLKTLSDYENNIKGWVPINTEKYKNKQQVKDWIKSGQDLKNAYYNPTEDAITYFSPKPKKSVIHNVYQEPVEEVTPLKNIPYQEFKRPEQQIIPAPPYVKPVHYAGPRHGTWSDGSKGQFPQGLNTSDWERKTKEYQQQQRGAQPIVTRKQGGSLDKAQKGRTVTHTNRDDYNKAFAAEADSLSLYNDSRHAFNKFTRAGDRFNTNLNPEQWKKASNEYDKLLDLQEKKWHTFPYKNGDVSQYIPGYTANYKYKGPRSGLIIKPVGVEKFYREGYDFPKFKKPVIHNIIQEPKNEITPLKNIPYQQSIRPEQQIIPAAPYKKPVRYSGPRYGVLAGDENLDLPEGYTQEQKEAARRDKSATDFQQKNLEYQEQEKAKINSRLKPASLTENFRQGGALHKAQYGEEFDYDYDKYKTAYYKSNTPNEESEMPNTQVLPEVTVKPENLPDWLKYKLNYDKVNPYDQYLAKRHNEYKKTINKKFANSLGLNPDTLPESKEKEFKSDYENLRNSYITKSLGKQKGFNPNRHREWVDQLSPKEREIVSQSTYGENLQPSYWARGLAGAQELVNAGVKATGVPALFGNADKDVLNYKTPGLTNKEWNEIHNSSTGALETAAPLDIPGVAIANYLKNTNRDQPNIFSGKPMANVSQGDAAALNPFLLSGVGEMMAGKSLLGVGANSLKSGAKSVAQNVKQGSKYLGEGSKTTGSTLNAGISPQLIKNFIGTGNKVGANLLDKAYFSPALNKFINKYSPLNLIKGYGSKLEGTVKPLGNVLGRSIKDGNIVERSLFGKTKNLSTKIGKTNAENIYSAKISGSAGSNVGTGSAYKQNWFNKSFNKKNPTYPIQTQAGTDLTKLPVSDPGVALHRRLPFSNRYVPIDKQKLLNNKFQWSTTGAGLQNITEKYGRNAIAGGLGYGAYNAYNYDKNDRNTYLTPDQIEVLDAENKTLADEDKPSRAEIFAKGAKESYTNPLEYVKNPDPYYLNSIYHGLNPTQEEKNGGSIESWEDDLDEEEIRLLKEAGFIVEELK
jgi:hypothetical protein